MSKNTSVFELNGGRYDALTGAYISKQGEVAVTQTRTHKPPAEARVWPAVQIASQRQVAAPVVEKKPAVSRVTSVRHMPAHKPQHTRTLMRHAVKPPRRAAEEASKGHDAPEPAEAIVVKSQTETTVIAVRTGKSQHSQDVGRSHQVKHFKPATTVAAAPVAVPVPVPIQAAAPPVIPPPANQAVAAPPAKVALPTGANTSGIITPAAAKPAGPVHAPERIRLAAARPMTRRPAFNPAAAAATRQPAQVRSAQSAHDNRHEQDIFEQALALATSHEQKPLKLSLLRAAGRRKKLRRTVSIAASAAVFLLLAGFIVVQNKAAIQMQMASAKAGFAATTPGYQPEGFSMDRIDYGPGTVATWYSSEDKSFSVVQKKSNWDSQTLLENFVATTNEDYEGYQVNGRTIYLYGAGRATWVNGGIWYQVQAGDVLTSDQLLRVARSM